VLLYLNHMYMLLLPLLLLLMLELLLVLLLLLLLLLFLRLTLDEGSFMNDALVHTISLDQFCFVYFLYYYHLSLFERKMYIFYV